MYSEFVLKMIPKVLSQVDRDRHSKTFGDCDRNHWHLKIRDFSSAILQQTGLTMALLYSQDFPGNVFYRSEVVKEWAEGTVHYWKSIQLRDGSFNEYYPNEHGFPPTAFSLYAMCETYKRLEMNDPKILQAFAKTARYLAAHVEEKAYNQELASITALYSAYTILEEGWIKEGADRKLERILELQSPEGWFPEYGGADIGYLSVSLDMLAEYYWMSRDERVLEPLNRVIEFLQYFIHPDGSTGGEYASRNTVYFLPNGLQIMSNLGNKKATAMLRLLYKNPEKPFYFLDAVDDRYCSHYLMHSFLRAIEKNEKDESRINAEAAELPFQYDQERYFKWGGVFSCTQGEKYIIIGASKGGICRVFNKGKSVFSDYGYRVVLGDGRIATTNWQNLEYGVEYKEPHKIKVRGNMNLVKQKVATPVMHAGLRAVSAVVGNKIIGMLKKMIIFVDKKTNIQFERQISIQEDSLVIEDKVYSPANVNLECADSFSLRHVASGKFFTLEDIGNHSRSQFPGIRQIEITRIFYFDSGKIEEKVLVK